LRDPAGTRLRLSVNTAGRGDIDTPPT
jgi:hypothetical protein